MILGIDTATLQASVALLDGSGALLSGRRARVGNHSSELLPMVEAVLAEGGVDLGGLAAIACGAGPGSFTGLRIGLATAKGLCFASGRPLLMVSSLAALARRAPPGVLAVPCIDAYKGEVYVGHFFRGEGDSLSAVEPEVVIDPARVAAGLSARVAAGEVVQLVGDGPERWPALLVPGVAWLDRAPPDGADVARLALFRLHRGEQDDLAAAVPTYIRPSEAEINGPPPNLPRVRRPLD